MSTHNIGFYLGEAILMSTHNIGFYLGEAILMSTHNIGFHEETAKIIFQLSLNIIKYILYLFFCSSNCILYRLAKKGL